PEDPGVPVVVRVAVRRSRHQELVELVRQRGPLAVLESEFLARRLDDPRPQGVAVEVPLHQDERLARARAADRDLPALRRRPDALRRDQPAERRPVRRDRLRILLHLVIQVPAVLDLLVVHLSSLRTAIPTSLDETPHTLTAFRRFPLLDAPPETSRE